MLERPEWPRAWSALGDARAAGLLGEDFGPGSDRAGAIEAWKRVVELDPEEFEHRVRLGSLLEHNALGSLRGEGSDLKEAAEQVWKAVEFGGGGRLPDAATLDLLVAGQDERIREILDSDQELTVQLRVALQAALDGAEAATTEAQRFAQTELEKQKLLAGAFGILFQLGELEAAAAIGNLAVGPQDGADAHELIETLENAARVDLGELLQENSPAAAMYRVMLFDPTRGLADATELMSSSAIEAHGGPEAARDAMTTHGRKFAKQMAEVSNSEVAIRVLAARDVFQVQTLAKDLVALTAIDGEQSSEPTFLVRERGRWKLLGEPGDEAVPLELRKRLARGDIQAARDLMTLLLPLRFPDLPLSVEEADTRELKDLPLLFGCSGDPGDCARRSGKAAERRGGYPRWELRRAELLWWLQADEGQRSDAVAQELVDAAPTSRALELLWLTQQKQEKHDEAAATLQTLLETNPDAGLQVRIRIASSFGDRDELERLEEPARKSSNPAYSLNNLAWGYLLAGMMEQSLPVAEEAVAAGERRSPAALHTLAAAYAEADRLEDARQTLLELREKKHNWLPREEEWYVIGRIAAGYGLTEQARAAYQRVQKPDEAISQSTWQLTQAALARLGD